MPPTSRPKRLSILCDVCDTTMETNEVTLEKAVEYGRSKGWYCGRLFDVCPNCRDKVTVGVEK